MNHMHPPIGLRSLRAAAPRIGALPLVLLLLPCCGSAQACPDFGSVATPPTISTGPALACAAAPQWPAWHLFTPAHRAPAPHAGFAPGNVLELPRVLVAYHCTGFLLVPVVPVRVRTMGYVFDQPEIPCAPPAAAP